MFNKKSKISNVVWEDTDKTLMKIVFQDIPDAVLESVNSKSWLAEKAKKQFSIEDIDRATIEYYDILAEQTILYKKFVDNYADWVQWKENKETQQKVVFDVIKSEKLAFEKMVKTEMESAFDIGLPLVVDIGFGENWLEAH